MPSITEAFRAHPVNLHHHQLDFNSAREVPDSHAWPPLLDDSSSVGVESVPVIDLEDPNSVKLMGHACETWGVFQITNHGIPMHLLEKVQNQGKRLFSLPDQQKLKAARSPDGISGYGVARISSFFPKLMWSEGFTIVGSPIDHARQLWPQDYNKFCDVMEEYEKEMKDLAGRLMWLMLGSLGITREDLKWGGLKGEFEEACAALQLNSYPACPDPNRAMGLAPITGALVVNVGDLLHILSNGRFPSALHRAVVNRTCHRLSVAYKPTSFCPGYEGRSSSNE